MKQESQSKNEIQFIYFSFTLLLIFIVGYKTFSYYVIRDIHSATTKIYQHPLQVSNAALSISKDIFKIHRDMKDITLSESTEELHMLIKKINDHENHIYESLSVIEKNILGDNGLKLQVQMLKSFKAWKPIRDEVIDLVGNNKRAEAVSITKDKGAKHVLKMEDMADKLYKYASMKALEFKNQSISNAKELKQKTFLADALFFILFILIIYYIVTRITKHILKNTHLNSALSVVRDVNQLIVKENSVEKLLKESCKILTSNYIYRHAWIMILDENNQIKYIASSDISENIKIFKDKIKEGWKPECIKKIDNQFVCIENTEETCAECPIKAVNQSKKAFNIELKHNNKLYGYLNIYVENRYVFDHDELSLLKELAGDIAYAIHNIENKNDLLLKENRYSELFNNMQSGVAVYKARENAQEFFFVDFNHSAEKIENLSKQEIVGKNVKEIFPSIDAFGLLDVFKRVSQTGIAENFPLKKYTDERISGWRKNYVYKLSSDEIVCVYADKTDEMNLKSKLQINEERYRYIVEGTTDGIWDWDLTTNEVYYSPRWKELLGYSDNELQNKFETWDNLLHPDDRKQAYADVKASQEGKTKLFKNINRLKHKDGHWVWIEARAQTIFDDDGKAIRMIGSHTDISEQKDAETTLIENQKRYETAEKIGKLGSWEYNVDTHEFWASNESKKIYGFSLDSGALTINTVISCIPEGERVHQALIDFVEKGTDFNLEFEIHPYDGSDPKIVSSIAQLEYDENNKPKKVLGFLQDITQQKKVEKLLEENKKELETIIQEAPNPIMIHNEDGKVLLLNKVWEKLTGYSYDEINTIEKWTEKAYGKEMPTIKKYIDNLYKLNHAVDEGEYSIITNSGKTIVWQFSSAPLGLIDGKRTVISSAMDITELKKKEEMMLNQSRQAAMGDMIAMIAHQWRQPLSVIGMEVNNIRLEIELEEEITTQKIQKMVEVINAQTQQLSQTIDDFRSFFKPNQERIRTTVASVLKSTLKIVGKSLENNNIALLIENRSETEFLTYSNQLLQVFLNLLGNAKDILLDKAVADAKITITVDETQDSIITTICDNGGGIPKDIIKRLGEPYFTTKEKNGTGLGLYMSITIIAKRLNGSLTWENRDDGACFIMTLPKD